MVVAVFVSNLPEGIAATDGLRTSNLSAQRILGLWLALSFVFAAAAALGYTLVGVLPVAFQAFVQAFAAGALLTMLGNTMIPEAMTALDAGPGCAWCLASRSPLAWPPSKPSRAERGTLSRRRGKGDRFVDMRRSQAHLTRRRLLKLTAAGAVGLGVSSLTATAASAHTVGFQAPRLQASHITVLVNSGDGVSVRALGDAYTSHTGRPSRSSSSRTTSRSRSCRSPCHRAATPTTSHRSTTRGFRNSPVTASWSTWTSCSRIPAQRSATSSSLNCFARQLAARRGLARPAVAGQRPGLCLAHRPGRQSTQHLGRGRVDRAEASRADRPASTATPSAARPAIRRPPASCPSRAASARTCSAQRSSHNWPPTKRCKPCGPR